MVWGRSVLLGANKQSDSLHGTRKEQEEKPRRTTIKGDRVEPLRFEGNRPRPTESMLLSTRAERLKIWADFPHFSPITPCNHDAPHCLQLAGLRADAMAVAVMVWPK